MLGSVPSRFDPFAETAAESWLPGDIGEIAEGFWSQQMATNWLPGAAGSRPEGQESRWGAAIETEGLPQTNLPPRPSQASNPPIRGLKAPLGLADGAFNWVPPALTIAHVLLLLSLC